MKSNKPIVKWALSRPNYGRTSRFLCALSASSAFILGIMIGVFIPFYIIPLSLPLQNNNSFTPNSSYENDIAVSLVRPLAVKLRRIGPPGRTPEYASQPKLKKLLSRSSVLKDDVLKPNSVELPSYISRRIKEGRAFSSGAENKVSFVPKEDNEVEWPTELRNSVTDGIYWSQEVEGALPRGFSDESIRQWGYFCRRGTILKMEEGCGRMQNRLLTFDNGTRSCCRYRQNFDQIQGEIFSFYLSQVLQIPNLVPSALSLVRSRGWQWNAVRSQVSLAQWAENKPIVLTQFIDNLGPSYIPAPLRHSSRHLHPTDILLSNVSLVDNKEDIVELAQWSDLIIFDYLTANLDRIVNNLYNLQWNPSMMEAPAHNLARDSRTGLLVFLDNESGLLHGYRLLEKYEQYHRKMLDALCIFRRNTADIIKYLHRNNNIGQLIKDSFLARDSEFKDYLPMLPDKSVRILEARITKVHEHIRQCERTHRL